MGSRTVVKVVKPGQHVECQTCHRYLAAGEEYRLLKEWYRTEVKIKVRCGYNCRPNGEQVDLEPIYLCDSEEWCPRLDERDLDFENPATFIMDRRESKPPPACLRFFVDKATLLAEDHERYKALRERYSTDEGKREEARAAQLQRKLERQEEDRRAREQRQKSARRQVQVDWWQRQLERQPVAEREEWLRQQAEAGRLVRQDCLPCRIGGVKATCYRCAGYGYYYMPPEEP